MLNDMLRMKNKFLATHETHSNSPMLLIGRRQIRSNNSWMHNSSRMRKGKETCTLLIHPTDASRHQIANGETVELRSRTGAIFVIAEISGDMMPGVVSLPHGWGHNRTGIQLSVASQNSGTSFNDITDDHQIDQLSGNAALNGVPVTLSKF
jgi:anaerobic selenocysteine-containing dehydrogenase